MLLNVSVPLGINAHILSDPTPSPLSASPPSISAPIPHPQALFVKYYDTVMPLLSSILVGATDKLHRLLRAKALECISLVAMVRDVCGCEGGGGRRGGLHRLLRAKALECISLVAMLSSRGGGGALILHGGRQALGAWGHGHTLDYIIYPQNNPPLLFRRLLARIGFARMRARSWRCCSSCRHPACWRRTTPHWAT